MKFKKVFVGIEYVGLTENEEEKKKLAPQGQWIKVLKRPKLVTGSREKTALKMLKQLKNRKHSSVYSAVGTVTYRLSNFFPNLLTAILRLNYKNK